MRTLIIVGLCLLVALTIVLAVLEKDYSRVKAGFSIVGSSFYIEAEHDRPVNGTSGPTSVSSCVPSDVVKE